MRLRLWHAADGTRVAYREAGTGPGLALLHSLGLSHRELEPAVEHLAHRYRVVLPDLPLHGDSEDRPRHPYTLDWYAEVMAGFCREVCGPRPLVGGHGFGAEVLLHATLTDRLAPEKLIVMPNRLHRPATRPLARKGWRLGARAGAVPGLDRVVTHAAHLAVRPEQGLRLSARANPAARDLVRHAFADVGGNANLARSWARLAKAHPANANRELLEGYRRLTLPVLLLWADEDTFHPLDSAEEALGLLPDGQLRVLERTGFLVAYDDPVGVAREIAAFA
ncbi:MAG: alpha/beta fold hydrolase [Solirubrobacteraceae bacterium]